MSIHTSSTRSSSRQMCVDVAGSDFVLWSLFFESAYSSRIHAILSSLFRSATAAFVERVDVCWVSFCLFDLLSSRSGHCTTSSKGKPILDLNCGQRRSLSPSLVMIRFVFVVSCVLFSKHNVVHRVSGFTDSIVASTRAFDGHLVQVHDNVQRLLSMSSLPFVCEVSIL